MSDNDAVVQALRDALQQFVECARYTPHMDGGSTFAGWRQNALREAEKAAREALSALKQGEPW